MQLSSEKLKSNLSHKVEAKNKSIVELENVVNEVRMKNKQMNNKVIFTHFLIPWPLFAANTVTECTVFYD